MKVKELLIIVRMGSKEEIKAWDVWLQKIKYEF